MDDRTSSTNVADPAPPAVPLDPRSGPCRSCGLPQARTWTTSDGPVRLCPSCATFHGLGCP